MDSNRSFPGVAARALHLWRGVGKPSGRVTYIVVEGLCRFSTRETLPLMDVNIIYHSFGFIAIDA